MNSNPQNRRKFFTSLAFGTIAISAQALPLRSFNDRRIDQESNKLFYRYPAIDDHMVSGIVSAAHSRFDTVKELVKKRPELAKAGWDWGFGDYETALGAASHMGRKDIAEFLIQHGASPDIFTFAMLGELDTVKSMIKAIPGIQKSPGPHGITLLKHAKNRLRHKNLTSEEIKKGNDMVTYLISLGNADLPAKSLPISEEEQKMYFGEYRWGPGQDELLFVKLNMQKMLQIGRKGTFGRAMHKIGEHQFAPGGAPSVKISFEVVNNQAVAMTIHEPDPILTIKRVL